MKAQVKLYKKFKDAEEFELFIRQCEESNCYPWSLTTLKILLDRQRRWPNRTRGYSGQWTYYDCSWSIVEKRRTAIEHWRTFMALKYLVTIETYTELVFEE
jgi:hypothetical protein